MYIHIPELFKSLKDYIIPCCRRIHFMARQIFFSSKCCPDSLLLKNLCQSRVSLLYWRAKLEDWYLFFVNLCTADLHLELFGIWIHWKYAISEISSVIKKQRPKQMWGLVNFYLFLKVLDINYWIILYIMWYTILLVTELRNSFRH